MDRLQPRNRIGIDGPVVFDESRKLIDGPAVVVFDAPGVIDAPEVDDAPAVVVDDAPVVGDGPRR